MEMKWNPPGMHVDAKLDKEARMKLSQMQIK